MIADDTPLDYIKRTAEYYRVLGYGAPYEWATYADVPFTFLPKPLNECTVAIVTTAALHDPNKGDQAPGAPYNADAKFYSVYTHDTNEMPDLRISHIAIDRDHTTAEDIGTFFPLIALKNAAAAGTIGTVSNVFFGLPTNRSKNTTLQIDCVQLVSECKQREVDAIILVPNCPVCHQSVSLAARSLEEAGISTVIMGCAKDIVENVGVPRFLFSDFPLGNSAGLPNDAQSQETILHASLDLLKDATEPRTTKQSPFHWVGQADWKSDYSNAAKLSPKEIAKRKAAFDEEKVKAAKLRSIT